MINVQRVSKVFGQPPHQKLILDAISLEIRPASCTLITGVSGSGKSTLLSLLGGLDSPTSGTIYWKNKDIASFSQAEHEEFLNSQCGYLFQYPYLIPELTIIENIIIKGLGKNVPKTKLVTRGLELLELVGLTAHAQQTPEKLSGGEQQRVALMRALFHQPAFLFADEPFAHLDATNAQLVMQLLKSYQQEYSLGIVLSSHPHQMLLENKRFFEHQFELKNGTLLS